MLFYSKNHENVGRKFKSPYFGNKVITITEFKDDAHWKFTIEGDSRTRKNQSKMSHYVNQGLEVKEENKLKISPNGIEIDAGKLDIQGVLVKNSDENKKHTGLGAVIDQISSMNTVFFAKVFDDAIIPTKNDEDAGYDFYSVPSQLPEVTGLEDQKVNELIIEKGTVGFIPTGIASAFDKQYFFNVNAERSSVAKYGVAVLAGVIDSGYRGQWQIMVSPLNKTLILTTEFDEVVEDDENIYYPVHKKAIAQGVLLPVPDVKTTEISYEELKEIPSTRGTGGWGSSGK